MENKQRNFLLDNCKGLLIFLVVFGHSLEFVRKDYILARVLYVFIYQFHMPVFIFISGYLSKNLEKGRRTAVRNLLIPFLFFNTIWNVAQHLSAQLPFLSGTIGEMSFFSFFTPGWALWYIFAMFVWRSILPDIVKIKHPVAVSLVVGILSGLFSEFGAFMSLARIITFTPFFLMGYYMSEEKLVEYNQRGKLGSFGIITATLLFSVWSVVMNIPDEILWSDRSYDSFRMSLGDSLVLAVVGYVIGFLFVYVFANVMPNRETFLSKLGRNTLPVYLLHTYLVVVLLALSSFIPIYPAQVAIVAAGAVLVTFLLSRDRVAVAFSRFLRGLNKRIFISEGKNG